MSRSQTAMDIRTVLVALLMLGEIEGAGEGAAAGEGEGGGEG